MLSRPEALPTFGLRSGANTEMRDYRYVASLKRNRRRISCCEVVHTIVRSRLRPVFITLFPVLKMLDARPGFIIKF